jgi:quinoprotein glucose dehydrogenase
MLTRAMRISVVLALLGAPHVVNAQAPAGSEPESTKSLARGEWPAYAGTYAAARYSPLAQVDRNNAKNLHIACAGSLQTWRSRRPIRASVQVSPMNRHR